MHRITIDKAKARLEIVFTGTPQDQALSDFGRELREKATGAKGKDGRFDLLVDLTGSSVLTKEDTPGTERNIAWLVENGLRRSANIVGSMLVKLQMQRIAANPCFQTFASRAEAIAWLDSAD